VVRQCIRFYSKLLLEFPEGTWARIALLDTWHRHSTRRRNNHNWFTKLFAFLHDIGVQHSSVHPTGVWLFNEETVVNALRDRCHRVFWESPPSKVLYYHSFFGEDLPLSGNFEWKMPAYLNLAWPDSKVAALARFRLRNHFLRIETGGWGVPRLDPADRLCVNCSMAEVEDEEHLVYHCSKYNELRSRYPLLFAHDQLHGYLWEVMQYDRKHADWSQVMKSLIRFLLDTGRVFRLPS
jgi:hypothetical protein